MNEVAQILSHRREAGTSAAVLATVVHVRGSAYRRPGARMLIGADGTRIGTVSGGCLETEVVRKAWWWTDGGPTIRVFDNSSEDAARDFGLGCNGEITVLLERADGPAAGSLLDFLERNQRERRGVVVATVVASRSAETCEVGDRALFAHDGRVESDPASLAGRIVREVWATFAERAGRLVRLGDADVFVEWVPPAQRLFVFGAGHDAVPLVAMAGLVGWQTTVADSRESRLDAARFAGAGLFPIPPSGDISALGIGEDDAVVVMTHNFPEDVGLVPQLLEASPRYLGLLGPKRRARRLFDEIGWASLPSNVYAPVGLDVGAEHPETIALSVVTEVQAVLGGRAGGHLRARSGSIHEAALETGNRSPLAEPAGMPATMMAICGLAATA